MAPGAPSRTVGVLGGMGPAATLDFHAKVLAATKGGRDQDHLRLIIDSNPAVPDRSAALRGEGPSPGPALAAMARGLEQAGAEVLVMPCNTAHAWADEIREATSLPFIDLVEAAADAAVEAIPGLAVAGVLETSGCLSAQLYHRAFERRGVAVLTPRPDRQAELMSLIGRIKSGDVGPQVRSGMAALARGLVERGAEAVVAGCTEIPLVLDGSDLGAPLINSTDVLVKRTVSFARQG